MALAYFRFELVQCFLHPGGGLLTHFGVDTRLLDLGRRFRRHTPRHAQLVRPHRHRWQWRRRVTRGSDRHGQRTLERVPDRQQLAARGFQQRRELHVDTGPAGVGLQRSGLLLPVRHVVAQTVPDALRRSPRLGGQDLDTLGQQHRGLALHLHPVLQVFDDADAFDQLALEAQQRLPAQRGAGLGGVALPGHGIRNIELGHRQQALGLGSPFGGYRLLVLGAPQVVETLAHRARGTLVAGGQLAKHLLQLLLAGVPGQPGADPGGALAGRGGCESAAGHGVKLADIGGLGGCGHRHVGPAGWRVGSVNRVFSPLFPDWHSGAATNCARVAAVVLSCRGSIQHAASTSGRWRPASPPPGTAARPAASAR